MSYRSPKFGIATIMLVMMLVAAACSSSDESAETTQSTQGDAAETTQSTQGDAAETTQSTQGDAVVDTPDTDAAMERLTVGLGQNPISLDPQLVSQNQVRQITNMLYDPLVWTLFVDGETIEVGGLAERWEINSDTTEFTFFLKEGVTFHDGTPFNAEAVKFAFDRIVDPTVEAPLARASLGPYDHSEVIDDHTIKVVFSEPNALFISSLSTRGMNFGSPTAIQSMGDSFGLNPVGTGAYIFEEFADRQFVRLSRNPAWSGWSPSPYADVQGPDELVFRILEDGSAQFNAVQTGEIDIAESGPMSPQDLVSLRDSGEFTIETTFPRGVPFAYIFNMIKEPTSDLLVRQAISHAIDKARLIEGLGGVYVEAKSTFTSATPGYLGENRYPYDPEKAGALLDEAGWILDGGKRTKDGQPLRLDFYLISDFPVWNQITPFVQAQLKELGVEITIFSQSWPGIGETLRTGVHDVAITGSKSSSAMAVYNSNLACASDARQGGFNFSFYCSPEIEALVKQAAQNPDPISRTAALESINMQIMEDAPFLPMVENNESVAMRNGLEGLLSVGTDGIPLFWAIYEN